MKNDILGDSSPPDSRPRLDIILPVLEPGEAVTSTAHSVVNLLYNSRNTGSVGMRAHISVFQAFVLALPQKPPPLWLSGLFSLKM